MAAAAGLGSPNDDLRKLFDEINFVSPSVRAPRDSDNPGGSRGRRPREAVERFAGPVYIQHNPLFADGTDAFIAAVTAFTEQNPQLHVDIRTVIAEGDRVLTHSLLTLSPADRGTVAADIFRLDRCRIVEHWDVV
jgi:predicted SnoaL-like aldol condensation-catalyzing enzyme